MPGWKDVSDRNNDEEEKEKENVKRDLPATQHRSTFSSISCRSVGRGVTWVKDGGGNCESILRGRCYPRVKRDGIQLQQVISRSVVS